MSKRLAPTAAVILVFGVLFSPHKPSARQVNPRQLLTDVLRGYQADENAKKLVLRNYTPLVEGQERIAGRDAWLLRLKPRVKHRPWRQIWIDKRLLSILAVRDWSHEDKIRRSIRLDRASAKPSVGFSGRNHAGYSAGTLACAKSGASVLIEVPAEYGRVMCRTFPSSALRGVKMPSYMPSGFELTDASVWADDPGDKCVIYSDGLFNISLFYRFSSREGREQEEHLNAFDCGKALAVDVTLPTGSVTVMADLPEKELLRIARSIR